MASTPQRSNMKIYIWKRDTNTFVIMAESAQDAADKLNIAHPGGFVQGCARRQAAATDFSAVQDIITI